MFIKFQFWHGSIKDEEDDDENDEKQVCQLRRQ